MQPDERTPPPRPRPAHDGAPLTEAELGQALRELRDTWAGLTQVTLAKWAGLSDSVVSARELGHGVPTTKVLDKFVITCLQHRSLTPQEIVTELGHWQKARNALDLRRRQHVPTAPSPQPDPDPVPDPPREPKTALAPVPAVRDDSTQQAAPEAPQRCRQSQPSTRRATGPGIRGCVASPGGCAQPMGHQRGDICRRGGCGGHWPARTAQARYRIRGQQQAVITTRYHAPTATGGLTALHRGRDLQPNRQLPGRSPNLHQPLRHDR